MNGRPTRECAPVAPANSWDSTLLLYDTALQAAYRAEQAIRRGDDGDRRQCLSRALTCVREISASGDLGLTPERRALRARIHSRLTGLLFTANAGSALAALSTASRILAVLRAGHLSTDRQPTSALLH